MVSKVFCFSKFLERVLSESELLAIAKGLIEKNQLPEPDFIKVDGSGDVKMHWFLPDEIDPFRIPQEPEAIATMIDIVLTKEGKRYAVVDWYYPHWGSENHYKILYDLDKLGFIR